MTPRREDLGSWLEGTTARPPGGGRLGLPVAGRGSPAGIVRRLVGLGIDWLLSLGVSAAVFPAPDATPGLFAGAPLATLGVFGVSTVVLVALLGHTVGHRVVGIRVARLRDLAAGDEGAPSGGGAAAGERRPRPPGPVPALVRTVLLCLVVPAAMWLGDGRGLHDVAAGTVIVRR